MLLGIYNRAVFEALVGPSLPRDLHPAPKAPGCVNRSTLNPLRRHRTLAAAGRKRSSLRSDSTSIFSFLLLSVGSYVPAPPAQPSCGRRRNGLIGFGAALISSPNPSAACPAGCPGSVGHGYAMLRQQGKNMVGRGIAGCPGTRPARAKRNITS
jgi:hypothetical protein